MITQTFRPATFGKGEQAGTEQFSWQKISVHNTNTSHFQQENSIVRYSVDGRLNIIKAQFGPRIREVGTW